MTAVVASNPSMDGVTAQKAGVISDLKAGGTIAPLVACVIEADGDVVPSNATAATLPGAIHGVIPRGAVVGEPVALYGVGTRFQWDDTGGLTPGAQYFVLANAAGGIDDTATVGDTLGAFIAVSTTDLVLIRLQGVGA